MVATKRTFLHDAVDFSGLGVHSLENDDFTDCFRSNSPYEMKSSGALYVFSFTIRYFVLFPIRFIILVLGFMLVGAYFLYERCILRRAVIAHSFIAVNKLMMIVFNCHVKHIGTKSKPEKPHIYVSNHTSFLDYIVLSSYKFSHACISEGHGGVFGFILMNILSKNGSIGFKRSDKNDIAQAIRKVREHINKNESSMLIFPEGTCVNNKYAVLFQKGAFELGTVVYPVAIKYKKDLLDPYWNRRVQGFVHHMFYLLTRWRIDVEVHWMSPASKEQNESVIGFSHRVKNEIAKRINLRNTLWNGAFKSSPVLNDRELLKECFSIVYRRLKTNKLSCDHEDDRLNGRFYLFDENIDQKAKDSRIYFDSLPYKSFINHCCKEYLRFKERDAFKRKGSMGSFDTD